MSSLVYSWFISVVPYYALTNKANCDFYIVNAENRISIQLVFFFNPSNSELDSVYKFRLYNRLFTICLGNSFPIQENPHYFERVEFGFGNWVI